MSELQKKAVLKMGPNTLEVPLSLFAKNRERLCIELCKNPSTPVSSYVLLQGGDNLSLYDTDVDYVFRQEAFFMWAWGVLEPGCYGLLDIKTGASALFVPHQPEEYAVWMGPLLSFEDFKQKYCVDEVYYTNQLEEVLSKKNVGTLLTLKGVNSDSGLQSMETSFKGMDKFKVDGSVLYPVMAECRVLKTAEELEVMRYVVRVSSAAHRHVMRTAAPGVTEYACESAFLDHCYRTGGCRHVSYTCICGSGPTGAVLHYGHAAAPNSRTLRPGDMCLFDMGANYHGYAADITCSFPVDGRFTEDQRAVYEAVLAAGRAVMARARPGVAWPDMHRLANRTMLERLAAAGLLRGSADDMLEAGLGAVFQPHGLGHLLGLDVHDVGGYLPGQPARPDAPGLCKLRTARVLQAGMVLTIEPGCYFIEPLLKKAFADPKMSCHLVPEVLERFKCFGGVRIEDDVIITENGVENITHVPRTVEEIENWMAGKDDDKY